MVINALNSNAYTYMADFEGKSFYKAKVGWMFNQLKIISRTDWSVKLMFVNHCIDSNAPTWDNNIDGQLNLRDAIRGTITYTNPGNNKKYALRNDGKIATLIVR